jgi:hypothetical protein
VEKSSVKRRFEVDAAVEETVAVFGRTIPVRVEGVIVVPFGLNPTY